MASGRQAAGRTAAGSLWRKVLRHREPETLDVVDQLIPKGSTLKTQCMYNIYPTRPTDVGLYMRAR